MIMQLIPITEFALGLYEWGPDKTKNATMVKLAATYAPMRACFTGCLLLVIQAQSLFTKLNMSRFGSFGRLGLLTLALLNPSTVFLRVYSNSVVRSFPFVGLGTFALAFLALTVSNVSTVLSSTLSCKGFEEAF